MLRVRRAYDEEVGTAEHEERLEGEEEGGSATDAVEEEAQSLGVHVLGRDDGVLYASNSIISKLPLLQEKRRRRTQVK